MEYATLLISIIEQLIKPSVQITLCGLFKSKILKIKNMCFILLKLALHYFQVPTMGPAFIKFELNLYGQWGLLDGLGMFKHSKLDGLDP
jgi:hypothetical protein